MPDDKFTIKYSIHNIIVRIIDKRNYINLGSKYLLNHLITQCVVNAYKMLLF